MRTFNIKETYVDKDDPWSGILAAAAFAIKSTTNRPKGYSPVQLSFSVILFSWLNIRWIGDYYVREIRHKLIKIISAKMIKELTTTIKSKIKS